MNVDWETRALFALFGIALLIDVVGGTADLAVYAWLGAVLAGGILISLLFPVYFGWREPTDRRR